MAGYDQYSESPNVEVVVVPGVQIFEKMPNRFTHKTFDAVIAIYDDMKTICVEALASEGVQRLRNEKIDLVILHVGITECFLSFVHEQKVGLGRRLLLLKIRVIYPRHQGRALS